MVRCGCRKRECRVCWEDAMRMPVPALQIVPNGDENPLGTVTAKFNQAVKNAVTRGIIKPSEVT